jgi:hypothetical protein
MPPKTSSITKRMLSAPFNRIPVPEAMLTNC